ncbi:MAG: hypothetical protein J4G18_04940 [Anaerolineae bacterium]|nr:hypothetical protein [Anaerolineae bacterium]
MKAIHAPEFILTIDGDGIGLFGQMIEAGFAQHVEEQTASDMVELTGQDNSRNLTDWAENLAILNAKRNMLENRLRETALNFVRYDSLHDKSKMSAKRRLLAVIPSDRRAKMDTMSSQEIIHSYYWSDLYKLILKEWRLFDPVFSDKASFERDCEIINDRPDAHAKQIDQADFALHRRSIDRIMETLEKRT